MTAEEFVRLCADEKKRILDSYFDPKSETAAGERIRSLTDAGVSADALLHCLTRRFVTITTIFCLPLTARHRLAG